MKIKAAVVREKGAALKFEEVDLAEPKGNEILVRNVASGICATDEGARTGELPIPFPAVLGHEGAGVVVKVGDLVKEFKPGDHVGFSYAFCNHCPACHAGHHTHCENYLQINFGGTATDGTTRLSQNGEDVAMLFGQSSLATYSVIAETQAVKIDPDVDLGLVAPIGCGIQTGAGTVMNTFKPRVSDSIAIYGMGAVGMSALLGAKVLNVGTIIAIGGNAKSLEMAKELGATHTINRKEVDDVIAAVKEITGGKGTNFTIDTSGYGPMIDIAIKATAWQGKVACLGATGELENFNVGGEVLMNMRTIMGVNEGDSVAKIYIPELIDLYKQGLFPLDKIITFYDFDDLQQAMDDAFSGKVIKAVVRISDQ